MHPTSRGPGPDATPRGDPRQPHRPPPGARDQGWLGEVAAIETTLAAAAQKLETMRDRAAQPSTVHLGMPDFRRDAGRTSAEPER